MIKSELIHKIANANPHLYHRDVERIVKVVFDEIDSGRAIEVVQAEHEEAARDHRVWGVPTFVAGGAASFVRLMDRPAGDGAHARRTVERVLDLLTWPELNEFKHTSIPR